MNIVCIDPRDRGVTKCKAIVPLKKGPVVNCIGGSGRPLFESRGDLPLIAGRPNMGGNQDYGWPTTAVAPNQQSVIQSI